MPPSAAHGSKDGQQQQQQRDHHVEEHAPVVDEIQAALHLLQAAVRQQLPPHAAAALPAPHPPSALALGDYYSQHLPHDRLLHLIQRMAVVVQSKSRRDADQQLAQLVGKAFLAGVDAADRQEAQEVMHMIVRPVSGLLWLAQEEPATLARAVAHAARYQSRHLQQREQQQDEGAAAATTVVRLPEVVVAPGMTPEHLVQAIQQYAAAASRANLAYPGAAATTAAAAAAAAAAGAGGGSSQGSKGTKRKREDAVSCLNGSNDGCAAALGGSSSSACAGDAAVTGSMDPELLTTPMALIVRGMGRPQPPATSAGQQQQQQQLAGSMHSFLDTLLQQTLPFHITPFHFNNGKAGQAACFLNYPLPGAMAWEVSLLCELAAWAALTHWAAQTPSQAAAAVEAGVAAAAAAAGGHKGSGASSSLTATAPGVNTPGPLTQQQVQASVLQAWELLQQGVLEGPGWRMFGVALRAWYPGQLQQRLQQQLQLQASGGVRQGNAGGSNTAAGTGSSRHGISSHQQQQEAPEHAQDPIQRVVNQFGCVLYAPEMVVGDSGGLGTAAAAAGLYDSRVKQQVRLQQQSPRKVEVQQLFSYMNAGPAPAAALAQVQQGGGHQLPNHAEKQRQQQQVQQQKRHKQPQLTEAKTSVQAGQSTGLPPVWGLVVEQQHDLQKQQLATAAAGAEADSAAADGDGEEALVWPCCLLPEAAQFVALTQAGPLDATSLLLMDDLLGTVLRWATQLDNQQQHHQQQVVLEGTGPEAAAAAAAAGRGGGEASGGHKRVKRQHPTAAAAPAACGKPSAAARQPSQQQQQLLVHLLHHLLSPAGQEPPAAAAGLQQLLGRLQQQRRLLSVSVGVTQPVDILSSWGTTTQLHLEQCALGSLNHLLAGAGKLWFVCATPAASLRLEKLVVSKFGSLAPLLDKQLGLQDFTLTELLDVVGMEVVWQEPGDLVLTLPGPSYHITVSAGPSLAVSANCYFDGGTQQLLQHLAQWAPRLVGETGVMLPQHQSVLAAFGLPEEEDWDVGLLPLYLAAELSAALEHGGQQPQQQQQRGPAGHSGVANSGAPSGMVGRLRAGAIALLGAFTQRGGTPQPQQHQQVAGSGLPPSVTPTPPPDVPAGDKQQQVMELCRQRCAQWLALGSLVKAGE